MNMTPLIVVVCLVACLAVTEGAETTKAPGAAKPIKCYNCKNCENITVTSAASTQCQSGINSCFKFFHSDKKVERGCSPKNGECPADTGSKVGVTFCYTCEKELCNSGPLTRGQALPIFAVLSVVTAVICRMKY